MLESHFVRVSQGGNLVPPADAAQGEQGLHCIFTVYFGLFDRAAGMGILVRMVGPVLGATLTYAVAAAQHADLAPSASAASSSYLVLHLQ